MTKHTRTDPKINMTYTEVIRGNHLLGLELLSVMRSIIIDVWAHRDNPVWIYGRVASIVAFSYVLHVNRAANTRNLVDVLGVIKQIWIFPDELLVAFEVNRVNL